MFPGRITMKPLLIAAALLITSPYLPAATYYKWVDDQGVTHYDVQPPEGQETQSVRTRRSASSDQADALERLEQDRARRARPGAEEATTEADGAVSEETRAACDQHRRNLAALTEKPLVRRENPETGEMEVLDQEKRAKILEQTRAAVSFCDSRGA